MKIDDKTKAIGAAIAVTGFFWTTYEYIQTRQIEAAQPYLEKKLEWCEDAVEITSSIAISDKISPSDAQAFAKLYWGKMGMSENLAIKSAMRIFGLKLDEAIETSIVKDRKSVVLQLVKEKYSKKDSTNQQPETILNGLGFRTLSLALAHACRDELANEWSSSWLRNS